MNGSPRFRCVVSPSAARRLDAARGFDDVRIDMRADGRLGVRIDGGLDDRCVGGRRCGELGALIAADEERWLAVHEALEAIGEA